LTSTARADALKAMISPNENKTNQNFFMLSSLNLKVQIRLPEKRAFPEGSFIFFRNYKKICTKNK